MNKQFSYAPVELELSYCGEASPAMRVMHSLLNQQICLLCYDEGKSVKELSESLQTDKVYIKDALKNLCEMGIVGKKEVPGKDDTYITLFPMIHQHVAIEPYKIRNDYLLENEIPKKINDVLKSCEKEIKSLDFYGNDLPLEYLNWFLYVVTDNLILDKIRSYYTEKTDEYLISSKFFGTQVRDFSMRAFYIYPDEKPETCESEKCWNYNSTFYNRVGSVHVNNVMDAKPFPNTLENGNYVMNAGRTKYLDNDNIAIYLKIIKADKSGEALVDLTEAEKTVIDGFIEHGVVKQVSESEGRYKGMVPYFTQEVFKQLEKIISKAIMPIAKELAENLGAQVEEMILPSLKNVKDRVNQFYIFWITEFMMPLMNMWWYGMNVEGLEIPEDYSKSAAAIYILED